MGVTSHPGDVTVVVPAYNVERYLGACLDSIIAQSVWPRCRVIVVDDGSTDGTAAIADDYASRHQNLSVVHQPNAGPGAGAARNHGLDLVETEFVLFVDGDDLLTPRALELLMTGLAGEGLDLAVGATEQFPEARSWLWSDYFVPGEGSVVRIEDVPLLAHDARTCNKLYRTSWLRDLRLRFAEGIHHQDTVVNVPAMLLAERFFLVGDTVHRYRKRAEGGSVMDSHFTRLDNYWDHLQVIEELAALRPRLSATRDPLLQAFIARSFQGFSWRAPSLLPRQRLREFFDRAAAVIRTLDTAVIEVATRGPGERTAYVTMLEDDFASFERLDELAATLEAHDGSLYLGVPASTEHRQLLLTGPTRALATGISDDRAGIRIQLRLRIRGTTVPPSQALEHTTLRALVSGDTVFSGDVVWTASDGLESIGEAFVPWPKLHRGRYELRLQFQTPTGTASRWVRRPRDGDTGEWAADVVHRDRRAQLTLGTGAEGRVVLEVRPGLLLSARRRASGLRRMLRRH